MLTHKRTTLQTLQTASLLWAFTGSNPEPDSFFFFFLTPIFSPASFEQCAWGHWSCPLKYVEQFYQLITENNEMYIS